MRLAAAFAALACTALPALETPLVFGQAGGGTLVTINPSLGAFTLIEPQDQSVLVYATRNLAYDLESLEQGGTAVPGSDEFFSWLRLGCHEPGKSAMKPSVTELLNSFSDKAEAGARSPRAVAHETEKLFWTKERPFDGKLSGALGAKLMVVAPSKHAVLFYDLSDRAKPRLHAAYNYGPALLVPTALNSVPTPQEMAARLRLTEEEHKALNARLTAKEGEIAAQYPASDPWTCANGNDFCLVDAASNRIITFLDTGREIKVNSIRNITIDLMVPPASPANAAQQAQTFFTDPGRRKICQDLQLKPNDLDEFFVRAFAASAQVGEGAKTGAFQATQVDNSGKSLVVLDFTAQKVQLVYDLSGRNNGLALDAVRNYTDDAGRAALDRFFREQVDGVALFQQVRQLAQQRKGADLVLRGAKRALQLRPQLHAEAEKATECRTALKDRLSDWEAILAEGAKATAALQDRLKATLASAAAMKEAEAKRLNRGP